MEILVSQPTETNHDTNTIKWNHVKTRKHSSRMRTAHLPTICVSMATTSCKCRRKWRGEYPRVNKFEQISSDDHQMSVAGNPMYGDRERIPGVSIPGPMLGGGGWCDYPLVDRRTPEKTLPSRNYRCGW